MGYNILQIDDFYRKFENIENDLEFDEEISILQNYHPTVKQHTVGNIDYKLLINNVITDSKFEIPNTLYPFVCNCKTIIINIPHNILAKTYISKRRNILTSIEEVFENILPITNKPDVLFDDIEYNGIVEDIAVKFLNVMNITKTVINKLDIPSSLLFSSSNLNLLRKLIDNGQISSLSIHDTYLNNKALVPIDLKNSQNFNEDKVKSYTDKLIEIIKFIEEFQYRLPITIQDISYSNFTSRTSGTCSKFLSNYLYQNRVEDVEELYKSFMQPITSKYITLIINPNTDLDLLLAPDVLRKSYVLIQANPSDIIEIQNNIYTNNCYKLTEIVSVMKYLDNNTIKSVITNYLNTVFVTSIHGFILYSSPTELKENGNQICLVEDNNEYNINSMNGVCAINIRVPFKYLKNVSNSINIITTNYI